jgi:hypothetical protein
MFKMRAPRIGHGVRGRIVSPAASREFVRVDNC